MFVGWIVCCCTLYKNAMVVSCLLAMYTCFIVRVCSYGVIHAFFVSYLYYPKKILCCNSLLLFPCLRLVRLLYNILYFYFVVTKMIVP